MLASGTRINESLKKLNDQIDPLEKLGQRLGNLTASVGGLITLGDELGKLSRQVNISIESLQGFQYNAEHAGVGISQFNKAIGVFQARIWEAQKGEGKLSEVLQESNKELYEQFKVAQTTQKSLELVFEAMRQAKSPAEKSAIAAAAFSERFVEMARFAEVSAEKLAEQREEQKKNGLITKEAANHSEDYVSAITKIKNISEGTYKNLLNQAMPAMNGAATATEFLASETGFLGKSIAFLSSVLSSLVGGALLLGVTAISTITPISKLGEAIVGLGAKVDRISRLSVMMNKFKSAVKSVLPDTFKGFSHLGNYLKSGFIQVISRLPIAMEKFKFSVKRVLPGAFKSFLHLGGYLKSGFLQAASRLTSVMEKFKFSVKKVLPSALKGFLHLGGYLKSGFLQAASRLPSIMEKFKFSVKKVLPSAFKGFLHLGGYLKSGFLQAVSLAIRGLSGLLGIIRAVGVAFLTNPIGLAIAAIAAAIYIIYDNWDNIVQYFQTKIDNIIGAFDQGFLPGINAIFNEFSPIVLLAEAMDGLSEYLFGFDLSASVKSITNRISAVFKDFDLITFVSSAFDRLIGYISNIDISSTVKKSLGVLGSWLDFGKDDEPPLPPHKPSLLPPLPPHKPLQPPLPSTDRISQAASADTPLAKNVTAKANVINIKSWIDVNVANAPVGTSVNAGSNGVTDFRPTIQNRGVSTIGALA